MKTHERSHSSLTPSRWARCLVLAGLVFAGASCSGPPPNPNPRAAVPLHTVPVDLPRYMGRWYVIANIPYFGERGNVGSYAEWTLRPDGRIDDAYVYRPGGFDAAFKRMQFVDSVVPGSGGGEWRVRLFWPIYVSQLTLYVDPDYRVTLLGYPDKSLGWVFSRDPDMSDADYRAALGRLEAMGYDTSRLRRVPQFPSQLGQPGFQSPGDAD
ncbi:lipocalin family protein [Ralstonia sp. SET104]|uniref:lipocalin family protein n=1 Tax=Ralstonia sp. SET104 TaxID=2448774 RepID=UPI0021A9837B|nr:lipocalin family protein [Ralstonia sp. SET104]